MINTHRRWLYHKEHEARIFDAGEEIKGEWYDSPAFDDERTKMVGYLAHRGPTILDPIKIPNAVGEPEVKRLDKKYPSQMNKPELIKFGSTIGLDFNEAMTKREMVSAIHSTMRESEDGEKEQDANDS